LRPYTDETIRDFGSNKLGRIDVVCPGFAADCVETLEEIEMRYGDLFRAAGGAELNYIPALNARDDHIAFLSRLVAKHAGGWPESSPDWSASEAARERDKSRQRALAMGATQ
jgi:ferrochelatase